MSETNVTFTNDMPRTPGGQVMRSETADMKAAGETRLKADADRAHATYDTMKSRMRNGWKGEDHAPAAEPRSYAEYKADLKNA